MKIPAKARVEVSTRFGACCLWEIKGLKEGTILDGVYNPANKALDWRGWCSGIPWRGSGTQVHDA